MVSFNCYNNNNYIQTKIHACKLFAKAYQQAVFSTPKRAGGKGGGFLGDQTWWSPVILVILS